MTNESWKRLGLPVAMLLAAFVALFSWSRLFYGLDLLQESRHVLYQLDLLVGDGLFKKELGIDQLAQLLVYPIFRFANEFSGRANSDGIVLHLRELKFIIATVLAFLLVFIFRHRVAASAMILFASPLVAFMPLGVPGVHPLSMAALLGGVVVSIAWRWMQQPTAIKSWILPLTSFLLIIACPEVLPVVIIGVLALFLRGRKEGESNVVKLHLAASLNISVFLTFLAARAIHHDGFLEAWRLQNDVLGWKGADLGAWQWPGAHIGVVWALALVLSFVVPSRFFHYLLAILAGFLAIFGWSETAYPAELLIAMLAPLVLSHFWKIRTSLPVDFRPVFWVAACLALALILGFTRGLPGLAVGLFPLMIFFFATGWVRDLRWPVLISAFTFSMLLVVAQFQRMPEGQSRRESLDLIESGKFKGLWTTRPVTQEMDRVRSTLERLPPGPVSLFVFAEKPGYYLLSELEPLGLLYRFPPSIKLEAEVSSFFSAQENLPDVAIDMRVPGESSSKVISDFFESRNDYQVFEDNSQFRLYLKKEFVESAMKRL